MVNDNNTPPTAAGNMQALATGLGFVLKPMIAIAGGIMFFAHGSPITACVFVVLATANLPTAIVFAAASVYFLK